MRQVRSQTSVPASMAASRLQDRDKYHYVKVQHANQGDWESDIESYLDKPSPSAFAKDEMKPMYEIVEDGQSTQSRMLTGSSKVSLLRCSMEDFLLEQKENARQAGARMKAEAKGGMGSNEFTKMEGGALSID